MSCAPECVRVPTRTDKPCPQCGGANRDVCHENKRRSVHGRSFGLAEYAFAVDLDGPPVKLLGVNDDWRPAVTAGSDSQLAVDQFNPDRRQLQCLLLLIHAAMLGKAGRVVQYRIAIRT